MHDRLTQHRQKPGCQDKAHQIRKIVDQIDADAGGDYDPKCAAYFLHLSRNLRNRW